MLTDDERDVIISDDDNQKIKSLDSYAEKFSIPSYSGQISIVKKNKRGGSCQQASWGLLKQSIKLKLIPLYSHLS